MALSRETTKRLDAMFAHQSDALLVGLAADCLTEIHRRALLPPEDVLRLNALLQNALINAIESRRALEKLTGGEL